MPILTIIAGPNGSGKSTITRSLSFEGKANLLDPDAVAKRIDPTNPARAAAAAGREVLLRRREYFDRGVSFAIETTLSGKTTLALISEAQRCGFSVHLFFVALDTPALNLQRVRVRVVKGGHDVPDADILRRYERSMENAPDALRLADRAVVYDNSGTNPVEILVLEHGTIIWRASQEPAWVTALCQQLGS